MCPVQEQPLWKTAWLYLLKLHVHTSPEAAVNKSVYEKAGCVAVAENWEQPPRPPTVDKVDPLGRLPVEECQQVE